MNECSNKDVQNIQRLIRTYDTHPIQRLHLTLFKFTLYYVLIKVSVGSNLSICRFRSIMDALK